MGFGDLVLDYVAAQEAEQACREIVLLLDEDYKNVEGGLQQLKEFCEGELVDGLQQVISVLGSWCSALIDVLGGFLNTLAANIRKTETTDSEGAQLLKDALNL